MIIFLSELQKEHLSKLHQHSTQVIIDFCKLALDYLNNGANHKKYQIAADKLEMTLPDIQNLVHALVYLMVEGCKHNLSDSDFKSSLAIAGFSNEQQEVLLKLYNTKKIELSEALYLLEENEASYQDFSWRFEVQIGSRQWNEKVKPMVTMDFVSMKPKNFGQKKVRRDHHDQAAVSIVNTTTQVSKAASHCQNVISHTFLQCDLPNLIHLTNKLEEALKESKSQHVRKVQRSL